MTIQITDLEGVPNLARDWKATHIMSFLDPGEKLKRPWFVKPENHFQQFFIDNDDANSPFTATRMQVEIALDWACNNNIRDNHRCIIHCWGGVARSTAMALSIWMQGRSKVSINDGVRWLEETRPIFPAPNLVVAKHADDILKLDGVLLEAAMRLGKIRFRKEHGIGEWTPNLKELGLIDD